MLATCIAYAPVRGFDFVNYDDPDYVTGNQWVRNGITPEGIAWAFTSGDFANWFPVTRLSEMLDCQLFGLNSGRHHLVNLGFHVLSVLLLFAFLRPATGSTWGSAFVAAVFALHPLHVESVAWVAERKDVLSAFFWFLSLWAWVRYVERRGWWWYAAALAAFCLGLMSKPMIVTLPFVLLLLDVWPLRRKVDWREKIPFFALAAAVAIVTYTVQRGSGAVAALVSVPLGTRIANGLISYVVYIGKTFWPVDLAVFYPYPSRLPGWQVGAAAVTIVAVSLLAVRCKRSLPYVTVGWFWYLGTLAPVIGIVQVGTQARADRYMYVPMVGLTLAVAWAMADLVARWPQAKVGVAALAVAACASCAVVTSTHIRYWQNSESLFRHALDVTSGNYLAHYNLGVALSATPGRLPEAVREFEEALSIRPDYAEASNNLGAALAGDPARLPEVIADYRAALQVNPRLATAHNNLGNALSKIPGRLAEAIAEYEAALRIKPDYAEADNNLGVALANTPGRMQDAISAYEAALRINSDYANAHFNLGNALATLPHRLPEAIAHYETALRLQPDSIETRINLASALSQIPGRVPDAIAEYQAVLRIRPDYAEAHYNIGNILSTLPGRLPDAITEYEAALRIRPDYAEAHSNLGAALARTPGRLPDAIAHFEAALRIRPDLPDTQYNLGIALLQTPGRAAAAIPHLREALRLRPDTKLQEMVGRLMSGK